jgi:hypothetical protein
MAHPLRRLATTSAAPVQRDSSFVDGHEESESDARGKCEDIDDPEAGESVSVPHASYAVSSVEMQQNDRRPYSR